MADAYTLQLIHASDLEAGLQATGRAPNFAALVDRFDAQYANTLTVIAGDAWIGGAFYAAEGDPAVQAALRAFYGNTTQAAAPTRVSVAFMNAIGTNAASFGNHEFDSGTGPISDAIRASSSNAGASFPYLSANYDFSKDPNLASLVATDGQEASTVKGKIAGSTVVTIGGQKIGVVGDTTQILSAISSPGLVTGKTPSVDDMDALARVLQPAIDALLAQGINKIVLSSHLQQYQLEQQLIPKLRGVDIVISAGSHALFADGTDVVRPGDTVSSAYPTLLKGADGGTVLEVNEANEYSYVGRLVVGFDAQGNINPASIDPIVSGSYATTDAVVQQAYAGSGQDPFAAGGKGAKVRALFGAVGGVINAKDGNVLGYSNVFLNGNRTDVRAQETNLGDISADANLALARQVDPTVSVSIKNGGGIRDIIGSYSTDAASRPLPTQANPTANKPAGAVSQLDIENTLRFNNNLSLVTVTAANLYRTVEHGVAAYAPGQTPGSFEQVGGIRFSFDPAKQAEVQDAAGTITTAGQRVQNLAVVNADGSVRDVIVQNGKLAGDPNRGFRVVTLDYQANGGDGYRFDLYGTSRVNLLNNAAIPDSQNTFAAKGTEQDALAKLLRTQYGTAATAYSMADTGQAADTRNQNLAFRADAVLAPAQGVAAVPVAGLTARGGDVVQTTLARLGSPFVLSAPTTATLGAPLAGQSNVARLTGGGTAVLPTGFRAAVLDGPATGELFDGGTDTSLLVGGAGGGTLVSRGANGTVVGGTGSTAMFGGTGQSVLVGGDGADTLVGGSGANQFFAGGGANLLSLAGTANAVLSEGRDTVVASDGSDLVGVSQSALVFARGGKLTFVGGAAASTVTGGTGSSTVFGGAGGGVFFGGAGGDNVIVAQGGASTVVGGGNGDVLFATGAAAHVLSAGSGNETLAGAGGTGANTFFAGSGANLLGGGAGNEVFFAGTGQATMFGGGGADLFAFSNGRAGGGVTIADFNQAQGDRVTLQGYAAGAVQAALATATSSGSGTALTLPDGTRITLNGVATLTASAFV